MPVSELTSLLMFAEAKDTLDFLAGLSLPVQNGEVEFGANPEPDLDHVVRHHNVNGVKLTVKSYHDIQGFAAKLPVSVTYAEVCRGITNHRPLFVNPSFLPGKAVKIPKKPLNNVVVKEKEPIHVKNTPIASRNVSTDSTATAPKREKGVGSVMKPILLQEKEIPKETPKKVANFPWETGYIAPKPVEIPIQTVFPPVPTPTVPVVMVPVVPVQEQWYNPVSIVETRVEPARVASPSEDEVVYKQRKEQKKIKKEKEEETQRKLQLAVEQERVRQLAEQEIARNRMKEEKLLAIRAKQVHTRTHSLTHGLTYSLTHLLTYSLTYSLTHSPTHSLTYSLTYSLTHSLSEGNWRGDKTAKSVPDEVPGLPHPPEGRKPTARCTLGKEASLPTAI